MKDIGRSTGGSHTVRRSTPICLTLLTALALLLGGCAVAPTSTAPSPEQVAQTQRVERANSYLTEGLRQYDNGNFDEALKMLLLALDSGLLTPPQTLNARKHLAFTHCVSNREPNCRDEFLKAFALDSKFELSPAEAGHPLWGAVFRSVKEELDARRSGRPVPAAPPVPTPGEKLLAEGMSAYDAAEYAKAIKLYQDAIKAVLSADDELKARKFSAFSYCLTNRMTLCRAEFEKMLVMKPEFELEPAEAGHPSWGPSFRTVKAKQAARLHKPTGTPKKP
jgi:tetratricopeptide (TPR) repeat protein